jgi:hypothetical protein
MSIQAPQGILNIPNATLRVGRLEISEVVGADTALNTIARNTILLVDGETYHENKNWGLKLPNAWAGEFECNTASAGNYSEFNFYNEGASSNAQGYNLTFNDTAAELRYDGTLLTSGTLPSTVTGTGVKKVRLLFERTILSVTVDGTLIFTHDDTGGPRPRVYSTTAGGFLNFFTDGGALKNLKIVNEKWISDGTSNIAYVGGGEVAVGQSLNLQQVSNTSMIKMNSNVVTEFPRSKKLIKYPRVALTSGQSGLSGGYTQDGYTVQASSEWDGLHATSNVFNNIIAAQDVDYAWVSGNSSYGTDGLATSGTSKDTFETIDGSWVGIKLPVKIKLEYINLHNRYNTSSITNDPKNGIIWARNDGTNWTRIYNFSNLSDTLAGLSVISVQSQNHYNEFRIQITEMYPNTNTPAVAIQELEFWGIPEYDPEAHGTDVVVKSVPNVPNTDWLEVYYDAKNYTSGVVQDESGNDRDGTLYGDTSLNSADGIHKFDFDGNGDYIKTTLTGFTGTTVTFSVWVFMDSVAAGRANTIMGLGNWGATGSAAWIAVGTSGFFEIGNIDIGSCASSVQASTLTKQWLHMTGIVSSGDFRLYQDGQLINSTNTTGTINYGTNPVLYLATRADPSGNPESTRYIDCKIANARLFNRALSSDEIYQLYAYQKEYFGHGDLSMTLKAGRLGIGTSDPKATLDIRGDVMIDGYRLTSMYPGFASGGDDVYDVDGYRIHVFTNSGTFTVPGKNISADVLVVGGGGGGGQDNAGGGGAGGLIFKPNHTFAGRGILGGRDGAYIITIGSGGAGSPNQDSGPAPQPGGDTTIKNLRSTWGTDATYTTQAITNIFTGKGGAPGNSGGGVQASSLDGGSGGGQDGENNKGVAGGTGTQPSQSGDSGTYGYGNNGGASNSSDAGGGGGGAGSPGETPGGTIGGIGGNGLSGAGGYDFIEIYGTRYGEVVDENVYFAGGGAGGNKNAITSSFARGGLGGGGTAGATPSNNENGLPGTGGGGAGAFWSGDYLYNLWGGNGGSGIVIIRYKL